MRQLSSRLTRSLAPYQPGATLVATLPVLALIIAVQPGSFCGRIVYSGRLGLYIALAMFETTTTAVWVSRFVVDARRAFCGAAASPSAGALPAAGAFARRPQNVTVGARGDHELDIRSSIQDRDLFLAGLAVGVYAVSCSLIFCVSATVWRSYCSKRDSSARKTPVLMTLVAAAVAAGLAYFGYCAYREPRRFAACDEPQRTDWLVWGPALLIAANALAATFTTWRLFCRGNAYPPAYQHEYCDAPMATADMHTAILQSAVAPITFFFTGSEAKFAMLLCLVTIFFFITIPLALLYALTVTICYVALLLSLAAVLTSGDPALEVMTHLGIVQPATLETRGLPLNATPETRALQGQVLLFRRCACTTP